MKNTKIQKFNCFLKVPHERGFIEKFLEMIEKMYFCIKMYFCHHLVKKSPQKSAPILCCEGIR